MSDIKHTRGPWWQHPDAWDYICAGPRNENGRPAKGAMVVTKYGQPNSVLPRQAPKPTEEENKANARLIAAAPRLYELLCEAQGHLWGGSSKNLSRRIEELGREIEGGS